VRACCEQAAPRSLLGLANSKTLLRARITSGGMSPLDPTQCFLPPLPSSVRSLRKRMRKLLLHACLSETRLATSLAGHGVSRN